MSSHARLSPSSAHRWMACPGSIREESKYENVSGPAAIDGTHSHTLLEKCINIGLMDADCFVGETLKDEDGEFIVDSDRAGRVQIAIDYIRERFAELTTPEVSPKVLSENKVDAGKWFNRKDVTGTVDVQIITNGIIEIIDYKDGVNPVDVEGNMQLVLYAIGALDVGTVHPTVVRMTIIQPKKQFKKMDPISTWEITTNELFDICSKIKTAALATDKPDAPLIPGDHCKYCRHKICSVRAQQAMEKSGISFDKIDVVQEVADKEPTELTDNQIKEILEAAPLMKQMIEAVEAEALNRLKAGKTINGFKIVHGRGSRSWSFDEEEMVEKLKKMGIPKTSIYTTKLVSPAQVEKLKWYKRDGSQKQLSDRQLARIDKEFISKNQGKLTVVSESDHRDGVTFNAAPMFEDVNKKEDELPNWLM